MITSSPSLSLSAKLRSCFPQFLSGGKQTHTQKIKSDSSSSLFLSYRDSERQAASPKTSSHTATLSWHCTGESSAGSRAGPRSLHPSSNNTRPQRDEEERIEGVEWSGGKSAAVRSACRCWSSPLAAAAVEASAAVMRSEEEGGRGKVSWRQAREEGADDVRKIHTLSQNTPIQQYFPHGH